MKPALASMMVLASVALAPRARADETCVECHRQRPEARLRDPVTAWRGDAHGDAGLGCSDCHRGDPTQPSARAHDLGRGFVGRPDALGAAQLCGRCHDGSTDAPAVLRAYRGSRHAHALGEGRDAATCTSCHAAHGVGERDESRADKPIGEIAMCTSCHSDRERMAEAGLPIDQEPQWTGSVHGRALAAGNEDAPVCASCHDPHGAAAGLDAVAACGRCHAGIRAAFERGPHYERFARLGFLDCAECHGSHEVQPSRARMLTGIDAVCARCHGLGQPMLETIARIAALGPRLDGARAELPRDDPRRGEILGALHALDAAALEAALEGLGPAAARPPEEESPPREDHRRWLGALAAVLAGIGLVSLARRMRRRA